MNTRRRFVRSAIGAVAIGATGIAAKQAAAQQDACIIAEIAPGVEDISVAGDSTADVMTLFDENANAISIMVLGVEVSRVVYRPGEDPMAFADRVDAARDAALATFNRIEYVDSAAGAE